MLVCTHGVLFIFSLFGWGIVDQITEVQKHPKLHTHWRVSRPFLCGNAFECFSHQQPGSLPHIFRLETSQCLHVDVSESPYLRLVFFTFFLTLWRRVCACRARGSLCVLLLLVLLLSSFKTDTIGRRKNQKKATQQLWELPDPRFTYHSSNCERNIRAGNVDKKKSNLNEETSLEDDSKVKPYSTLMFSSCFHEALV